MSFWLGARSRVLQETIFEAAAAPEAATSTTTTTDLFTTDADVSSPQNALLCIPTYDLSPPFYCNDRAVENSCVVHVRSDHFFVRGRRDDGTQKLKAAGAAAAGSRGQGGAPKVNRDRRATNRPPTQTKSL